ncbi:isocitrate lyase/phosphoenolpyruvate mutase family protein [Actinacidiphila glaucinigra]|uniref:isocitrate lyase/PEP mutase family protein n=1 Tax=Actinacidiphila glaucinigra TaxID=235986 RepID=UPI002DD9EDD4|nr:isocitrate lyase/phosphoenolpyruvate mutase family protein [Actinacidiphila glaucinigra]WSD63042.1 isocitrate lyase/phosphoenolpyruvate mutase family protein [Actinacidiphila glaucinigra]
MNRFEAFRALHRAGRPLFLPNAWDRASAAALAARGFPAIGTTSLGVAAAAGLPDAAGATRETTLWLARDLVRLPVLVSVDIEGGFGPTPEDVAELAADLERLGVAGVNIEDGRPGGAGLADPALQCELITAMKRTAPGLFVNARTDTHWLGTAEDDPVEERTEERAEETRRRAAAYLAAGADGIFVPGLADEGAIAALADGLGAPLNVLLPPGGPGLSRLAALGVSRVSTGSLLFRAALHAAVDTACRALEGAPLPAGLPSYAEAQDLAAAYAPPETRRPGRPG